MLHVPAQAVDDIVDTNGAGDAFLSGFLLAHLEGRDVEACLQLGHTQAARCLRSPQLAPQR